MSLYSSQKIFYKRIAHFAFKDMVKKCLLLLTINLRYLSHNMYGKKLKIWLNFDRQHYN